MSVFNKLANQMKTSAQDYRRVNEEMSSEFPLRKTSRATSVLKATGIALVTGICLFLIIWWPSQLLSTALNKPGYSPAKSSVSDELESVHHCGPGNVEEAQKLGCTWDLLAGSWLPQRCIDKDLTDEFRNAGDWHFYEDREGTKELQEEELKWRVGPNMTYFTTLKYHRTHCSFQWRKMHRAMQSGRKIENALANYDHTLHCGYVFLQDGELHELLTEISVEFFYC
jgi:hypothetical protein